MISIYENNKKINGACRSFVLCLDYVAISPFIYFKRSIFLMRSSGKFLYNPIKCDNTTGANTPKAQKAVATPRELT